MVKSIKRNPIPRDGKQSKKKVFPENYQVETATQSVPPPAAYSALSTQH
jgi:hypothetical protein